MEDTLPSDVMLDATIAQSYLLDIQPLLDYEAGTMSSTTVLSEEGQAGISALAAAIKQQVNLPPRIVATRITEQAYLAQGWNGVPMDVARLMRDFKYYYIEIPITIKPARGYRIHELEVQLVYNPGKPDNLAPINYDLFPSNRWVSLINAQQQLELVIDEGAKFKVQTPGLSQAMLVLAGVDVGGHIKAEVAAKASLILGPFDYVIRQWRVRVTGEGNNMAFWSFNDRQELEGDDELRVAVILQVPQEVQELKIVPTILANPKANELAAILSEIVAPLRRAMDSLRDRFGPEVEQQVDRFEQAVRDGWRIRVGNGTTVWDISKDL